MLQDVTHEAHAAEDQEDTEAAARRRRAQGTLPWRGA